VKYFLIVGAILLVMGLSIYGFVTGTYNNLITLRSDAETQQAEIQNQLQRRYDLVPNIVASTRGAMQQERAVFDSIAQAQAAFQRAQQGGSTQGQLDAGAQLGAALRGYLVVVQQYPELKSLDIVKDLNTVLEGTENRITVARTRYNEHVNTYNKSIQVFPGSMIANMFGFQKMALFNAPEETKVAPKVNLEFEEK
jgi:LemA protein